MCKPPPPVVVGVPIRWVSMLVLAVVAAAMGPRATAQMMPLVPDPITTPDLRPIVQTLGLSNEQVPTLLQLHDAYKQHYEVFQSTDVRELQDQLIEIGLRFARGRIEIPERKELEAIIDRFKRLLTKSQGLDRAFFTEIGGMLSPEQMPLLDRARINRELAVYREILGGVGEMNRGAGVNLAQIARGLDVSPQERELIEPIVGEYESALLSKSRGVYNVLADAAKVVLDVIDDLNIRGMGLEQMAALAQDPATIDRLRGTFDEASKPIQAAAYDVSQLNFRTYKRMHAVLGTENARELRDRYFRIAFREVYPGPAEWVARYRAALALEQLTQERRDAITAQRDSFQVQDDSAVDGGVATLEASREYKTFRQFSQEDPDPAKDKIDDAVARRKSVGESAVSTLNMLLGEELVAKLEKEREGQAEQRGRGERVRVSATVGAGGSGEVTVAAEPILESAPAAPEQPGARFLPQPMGAASIDHLAAALRLGEDDRSVVSTLYDTYRAEFERVRGAELSATTEGEEATVAESSKSIAMRQDELTSLDARLFDDLSLVLQDEESRRILDMFRTARRRTAAAEMSKSMAQWFGEDEAYLDLLTVIISSELSADSQQQARAALADYDTRMSQPATERLEQARDVQRRSESMQRASQRERGGNNQARDLAAEKWRQARAAMRTTNDKLVAVNREMLQQVVAAIPADAGWQLRLAYNQAAYPEIFRDERGAEKVLQGALALPDLAEHQRDRINEVATQYRGDFFTLCEKMVGLRQQRDVDFFGGQVPKKEDIDREIELERMRFARNELSARARMQLTLILSDEQAKLLPELQAK